MSYDRATLAARIKDEIETNPHVKLHTICSHYQLDRHTINRALRQCLGANFATLKGQIRDEHIRTALVDGQLTHIKEAAVKAGYSSTAALAKRTRKAFGASPTALRRRERS